MNPLNQLIPTLESQEHYIDRNWFGISGLQIADFARKHKINILNAGHAGTGKTSFAQYYASQRGLPYVDLPSNSALSANELQGNWVSRDGKLDWVDSVYVEVWRNGGVLNLGEIDQLAKNAQFFFHPALDHRRTLTLTAKDYEVVHAHPDLIVIADWNPMYRGRQPLSESWADRFQLKMRYEYDRAIESKIIKSESLLDLAFGMRSQSRGIDLGQASKSTIFETPITPRILKTFELVAKELSFDLACEIFTNNFTDEERPAVKMLLEGASFNIKDDLGIDQDAVTTQYATV
jgi:hypothetical protein